ncbi:HlyD family efflux transporter periplasmic adaptor subunit [Polynucleobacter paneuropaeus]|nr:HlyD family efflux transporter periplasmic adaptor subunit [Polynucleobacter paneuropaeus]MBT8530960.1 HlyD family efflux transporter periplasmic adaptor subunit [Polynucleobacter paneuropaeus]MBT8602483.1 HlyD family efflux transporter periplasmic adaptor subunit [Polynucleobacter paneuropaeus]MBT8624436.1 HlyD family efflux transporter periplasmic adaptor subunit [Polynucleobacter paneuropaeus]MBT8628679.1 HlyD family efflux transporter periplasmic adaptor subunit [Polynucleobacter paneuro
MTDDIKKPDAESLDQENLVNPPEQGATESHAVGPVGSNKALSKSQALVVQFKELDKKTESWIQSWNPYHPNALQSRKIQPIEIEESHLRKHATKLFLISFGIFMVWASFAPIDAGVSAPGTVMVSGYRKTLQHPTGGIVQDILVKEGDVVKEGDMLIRINPLKAEAELSSAQLQYINTLVTEARLKAERKGENKIAWPPELDSWGNEPRVEEAKALQQKLFETRRNEIVAVINGRRQQVATLQEEARNNATLAQEGYVSRAQANQVLRTKVDAELSLNSMQATYYKDIDTQLAEIQKTRDAIRDRFQAVAFDRDLTSIKAPVSGTVVGLKVNTKGGTIAGGTVLAEIVPSEVALVVDAQVPPTVIDKVKVGQTVDMRFTTFNQNVTPVIPGIVKLVGADKMPDPGGNKSQDFYLAQVEATPEGLKQLGDLRIQPGMPVDIIFKTGERTFLGYLFKPLSDRFAGSFKN